MITIDEMKGYLRVDTAEDDELISSLMGSAETLCMDVARCETKEEFEELGNARLAILFTTAYMYEHREEADHKALTMTLRALLSGDRKAGFC